MGCVGKWIKENNRGDSERQKKERETSLCPSAFLPLTPHIFFQERCPSDEYDYKPVRK